MQSNDKKTQNVNYIVFTFDKEKRHQLENLFVNLSPARDAVKIFDFFKHSERFRLHHLEKNEMVLMETFFHETGKWTKIQSHYNVFFYNNTVYITQKLAARVLATLFGLNSHGARSHVLQIELQPKLVTLNIAVPFENPEKKEIEFLKSQIDFLKGLTPSQEFVVSSKFGSHWNGVTLSMARATKTLDFFKGSNDHSWWFSLEFQKDSKLCGQLDFLQLDSSGFEKSVVTQFLNAFCFLNHCSFTEDLFSWKKKELVPFSQKNGEKKELNSRYME